MAKTPHYFYLINEALHAFGCFVQVGLGKSLNCKSFTCLGAFHFENSGKLSFAKFPNGFKMLMKTKLIDVFPQSLDPFP